MCYPQASCLHLSGRKALKLLFQISRLFRSSCHLYQPHSSMSKWFSTSVFFSFSPTLYLSLLLSHPASCLPSLCFSQTFTPLSSFSFPFASFAIRQSLATNFLWAFICFQSSGKYGLVNKKNTFSHAILYSRVCMHAPSPFSVYLNREVMNVGTFITSNRQGEDWIYDMQTMLSTNNRYIVGFSRH